MTQADRDAILTKLEQAVMGNGVKGLCERQDDTDAWQQAHEERHFKQVEDNHSYRAQREEKELEREIKKAKDKKNLQLKIFGGIGVIVFAEIIALLAQRIF